MLRAGLECETRFLDPEGQSALTPARATSECRYDAGHTTCVPPNTEVWGTADSTASLVRAVRMRVEVAASPSELDEFVGLYRRSLKY